MVPLEIGAQSAELAHGVDVGGLASRGRKGYWRISSNGRFQQKAAGLASGPRVAHGWPVGSFFKSFGVLGTIMTPRLHFSPFKPRYL